MSLQPLSSANTKISKYNPTPRRDKDGFEIPIEELGKNIQKNTALTPNEIIGHGIGLFKNKIDQQTITMRGFNAENPSELVRMSLDVRPTVIDISPEGSLRMRSIGLDAGNKVVPIKTHGFNEFQKLKQFVFENGYEKRTISSLLHYVNDPEIQKTLQNLSSKYTAIITQELNEKPLLILIKHDQVARFEALVSKKTSNTAKKPEKASSVVIKDTAAEHSTQEKKEQAPDNIIEMSAYSQKENLSNKETPAVQIPPMIKKSTNEVIQQPTPEKAIEAISEGIFSPVLEGLENITASDLTAEGRAHFLEKFKTPRRRAIAAFALDSWKDLVNNKGNEKQTFKTISEKFIVKMQGLFPSIHPKALRATMISQWKRFRSSVERLSQKYPDLLDSRVVAFKPKVQSDNNTLKKPAENTVIINGVRVARAQPRMNNPVTNMNEYKESQASKASANIIDFKKKAEEKTPIKPIENIQRASTPEPVPGKVTGFVNKAKGLFGKVTSFFKKAA